MRTPRPDSNGRAWVRSPLLSSSELRGGKGRRQQGSNLRTRSTRLRRSRALPYHSAMPPKRASRRAPAGTRGAHRHRVRDVNDGRRGSRTPKPVRATRFRDGVPRRWQSFRVPRRARVRAKPGTAASSDSGRRRTCNPPVKSRQLCLLSYGVVCDVAGRSRTCGAPRFRRALYRLSYGHGRRALRPPSISPPGEIDAVACGRPSSVASVRSTALFSMPLAHPSTLDRRPPAALARLVAVLRGGALEPDPQSVLENSMTNTTAYLHAYFHANA